MRLSRETGDKPPASQSQRTHYNIPNSGTPLSPRQRLCCPAAGMIQHLAVKGIKRQRGAPPACLRPARAAAAPIHRVTGRTILKGFQAVTHPAAPLSPALPQRTQRAPKGLTENRAVSRAGRIRRAVPRSPVTSTAQFPFRDSKTQTRTPRPSSRLLPSARAQFTGWLRDAISGEAASITISQSRAGL